MYYCIACKSIHKLYTESDQIFKTGYTLVNEVKIPLGSCQGKNTETPPPNFDDKNA